jgi:hypothetical protein
LYAAVHLFTFSARGAAELGEAPLTEFPVNEPAAPEGGPPRNGVFETDALFAGRRKQGSVNETRNEMSRHGEPAMVPSSAFVRREPLHLSLPMPTTRPIAVITRSSALAPLCDVPRRVAAMSGSTEPPSPRAGTGYGVHHLRRPPEAATAPAFAYNQAGIVKSNAGCRWVQPGPELNASTTDMRSLRALPMALLQRVLSFCEGDTLDGAVVYVSRLWNTAVREDGVLRSRRLAFVFTGTDYDGHGVLHHLARVSGASRALSRLDATTDMQRRALNPATGPSPPVQVRCSALVGPAYQGGDVRNVTSFGVSHFATENLPFSWVGVDLLSLRLHVTAYTLGTSTEAQPSFPTEWELQGTAEGLDDWGMCAWHVVDRQTTHRFGESSTASPLSATFIVERPSAVSKGRGPFRRLRIVQTARNAHWGHELQASGLEFYGNLQKKPATA